MPLWFHMNATEGAVMTTKIRMLAIDLAKGSFQVCAVTADEVEHPVFDEGEWTSNGLRLLTLVKSWSKTNALLMGMVPGGGIEPPTRGFSIHCSTPELPGHG